MFKLKVVTDKTKTLIKWNNNGLVKLSCIHQTFNKIFGYGTMYQLDILGESGHLYTVKPAG